MRAIRKFSLVLTATTVLLSLAVALSSVGANPRFAQSNASTPSPASATPISDQAHLLTGGLWRTDRGFVSTIKIHNILVVAPMDVTPVLFMADGTAYPLPTVTVPISGVATVNVNDALAIAPPAIAAHISEFGYVTLLYNYPSMGHVVASLDAIDSPRSLIFVSMINESMLMSDDKMLQVLEGLWWKHDLGVEGWIALSNLSDADKQVSVQLVGPGNSSGNDAQPARTIALPARSTQMLRLEDFAADPSTLAKQAGGIRLQYTGQLGSVQVVGGLENDTEGYSANILFWAPDLSSAPATSITYASAGLLLGNPDPRMMPGFPKETTFNPYLVLRNTTEKPLDVSLQLNYMLGMQASSVVTRDLPAQHLAPFEARQVDMQAALRSAGLNTFNGSINVSTTFSGKAGDLLLVSGSVDQTGTYVFEVEPQGVGTSRSKYANYWSAASGNDTMFSLFNPTNAAQDILATFYYGDGSGKYTLPLHLEPQASTLIDMAMLIAEHQPDADGNIIPPSVQEGSAEFASAKDRREWVTLVIASGIYNVSNATCGTTWINCCGVSNFTISPNPANCPAGQTLQVTSSATDCNGTTVNPTSWSSSNTVVMTVNSSGLVTGVSVGQSTISATYSNVMTTTGQICGPSPVCPRASPAPQTPATVFSVQVTNADIVADNITVTMTPSTLSGTLTLTVNGPGISYSLFQGLEQGNTVNFSFNRPQLPSGQYTYVKAAWDAGSATATSTQSDSFDVLGVYRHSQYNTPYESTCTGSPATGWIITGSCNFTQTTLRSDFMTQLFINGSGVSLSNGNLHYYTQCSNYPSGANSQNSFLQVSQITGSCNTVPQGGSTVATYPNPPVSYPTWECGDLLQYVTSSDTNQVQKSVQDYCPACNTGFNGTSGHIDDYSSSTACSGHSVGDYGNFLTIRLR